MEVRLEPPHLLVRFARAQRVASWAVVGGGVREADAVAWVEVRNADLTLDVDPAALLRAHLTKLGIPDAVGLLTSRALSTYEDAAVRGEGVSSRCVATVGLSNALRAGDPVEPRRSLGTINLLCALDVRLSDVGLLEALALASEAKALAIREAGVPSIATGNPASGTGTDCIVIACPADGPTQHYAGKHTHVGHVVGESVRSAIARGAASWKAAQVRHA